MLQGRGKTASLRWCGLRLSFRIARFLNSGRHLLFSGKSFPINNVTPALERLLCGTEQKIWGDLKEFSVIQLGSSKQFEFFKKEF